MNSRGKKKKTTKVFALGEKKWVSFSAPVLCSKPPLEGSGVLVSESGHGLLSLFSSMPGSEVPEDFEK